VSFPFEILLLKRISTERSEILSVFLWIKISWESHLFKAESNLSNKNVIFSIVKFSIPWSSRRWEMRIDSSWMKSIWCWGTPISLVTSWGSTRRSGYKKGRKKKFIFFESLEEKKKSKILDSLS